MAPYLVRWGISRQVYGCGPSTVRFARYASTWLRSAHLPVGACLALTVPAMTVSASRPPAQLQTAESQRPLGTMPTHGPPPREKLKAAVRRQTEATVGGSPTVVRL